MSNISTMLATNGMSSLYQARLHIGKPKACSSWICLKIWHPKIFQNPRDLTICPTSILQFWVLLSNFQTLPACSDVNLKLSTSSTSMPGHVLGGEAEQKPEEPAMGYTRCWSKHGSLNVPIFHITQPLGI